MGAYEMFGEKIGVKIKYLISDIDNGKSKKIKHENSISVVKYDTLHKRLVSKTCVETKLRSASYTQDALVEFDTLCQDWRKRLIETFGNPPEKIRKSFLQERFKYDYEAFKYFNEYRYGNNQRLADDVIKLYTYNASLLNAVIRAKDDRQKYRKALATTRMEKFDIWQSLSNDVNDFRDVEHNLPQTADTLRHKVTKYIKDNYYSVVSKKYGMRNATKVMSKEQIAILKQLLRKHQNLQDTDIASIYNTIGAEIGWCDITPNTVGNYRKKWRLETIAGAEGKKALKRTLEMAVKRQKPSSPMLFWTLDGWDAELLYQKEVVKNGKKTITYHNRLNVVVVLDPYTKYPIGYAIGEKENSQLIKEALRNAINHTRELFGQRYIPYQLQTDNFAKKTMTPLYESASKFYIPAKVGNAQSKVIERYFSSLNKQLQKNLTPNWSGHNITARSENQPNSDVLNLIKKDFPDAIGCAMQIMELLEGERNAKRSEFVQAFEELDANFKQPISTNDFLRYFGETTGYTNRLTGSGVTPTILGKERAYETFDLNFRSYAYMDWAVKYDPTDLSKVLVLNAKSKDGRCQEIIGTTEFLLEEKYIQPMALADRLYGDAQELHKIYNFNNQLHNHIIEDIEENNQIISGLIALNPQLQILNKLMITNSLGKHKEIKQLETEKPLKINKNKLVELKSTEYQIIDDVQSQY
ncbi:hypothetical protein BWK59_11655 [Flavobacterium davisii]|uniref:Integrase catalytic domain-containing protein n=1 Tax=Flavobacterium davisii TaxID=2906077 RepID=A0A246GGD0_9FLAO|nr:hypothetical protein [Flavobacterium davisii]OWP83225.1 hypothetical protein BWK59_11655 [Flavobacterium davisii]